MKNLFDILPEFLIGERAQRSNSWFQYAHSFVVYKPVMIEQAQIIQDQPSSRAARALTWLEGHALSGVEFHSSVRAPPPRCHQGTRLHYIEIARGWMKDSDSKQRLLWVHGPAGVGKSAIMQTLAELLEREVQLGATVFFPSALSAELSQPPLAASASRNASAIWLTIAYRLATTQPAYCSYIIARVESDPKLVEQAMEYQFDVLITEPFGRRNLADRTCLPILIDGLDRCRGHDTQKQIIRLILGFIEMYPRAPLFWIIASRREDHLKRAFQGYAHLGGRIKELFIPISSAEAHRDVQLFMRDSFDDLREEYITIKPSSWPEDGDFHLITCVASGLFMFISAVVTYIGNPLIADPISQLQSVISAINKSHQDTQTQLQVEHIDPLASVHDMYTQTLAGIPRSSYRTAKRILGFCLLPDGFGGLARASTSFARLCNILHITSNIAYGCLSQLHSLLDVPRYEDATSLPLRFFHQSFADYLLEQNLSGVFCIDVNETVADLWRCHLRILAESNTPTQPIPQLSGIRLAWPLPPDMVKEFRSKTWENARLAFFHHLLPCPTRDCAFGIHLEMIHDSLIEIFEKVNFSNVVDGYVCPDVPYRFIEFLRWILKEELQALQKKKLLSKLEIPPNNYDWINPQAVSFIIRSVRSSGGGCIITFEAYTDNDSLKPPDGIESNRLFSTGQIPKPCSQLFEHLSLHRVGILNGVIVGLAQEGQCALMADESVENETVYYVLSYRSMDE